MEDRCSGIGDVTIDVESSGVTGASPLDRFSISRATSRSRPAVRRGCDTVRIVGAGCGTGAGGCTGPVSAGPGARAAAGAADAVPDAGAVAGAEARAAAEAGRGAAVVTTAAGLLCKTGARRDLPVTSHGARSRT